MNKNRYVADFETTTDENDCRVWGWAIHSMKQDKVKVGTDLKSFFRVLFGLPNASIIYFHNLKFDGEFMLYYLLENEFEHTKEWNVGHGEFSTLIDGMGAWYSMNIGYRGNTYKIYDSLKIIPLRVEQMPDAFGLDSMKGDIDYNKDRPIGYQLTNNEKEYMYNDVKIVGDSLKYLLKQDLKKITQASNAFHDFKDIVGKEVFQKYFPNNTNIN